MKLSAGSVVLMSIGTVICCLMVAGVLFLIDSVIPLARFYLWLGLVLSSLWTLMSSAAFMESLSDESEINTERMLMGTGISSISMCAFGYLVFS